MQRVKQASKKKRVTKAAVPALGAAGLTFSLAGGASASAVPTGDLQQRSNFAPGPVITLGEEELADVSLATFHLFDNENIGSGVQLAARDAAVAAAAEVPEAAEAPEAVADAEAAAAASVAVAAEADGGGCGVGLGCWGVGVGCAGCCASWGRCRLC